MCGRYFIDDQTAKEIKKLLKELDENIEIKAGEIFPTNTVPIFTSFSDKFYAELVTWGFPGFKNNGVIINARAETVREKSMFKDSFLSRRCIIPASAFYEWDKEKNKVCFEKSDFNMLYMAGIFSQFKEDKRFAIITTVANDSMKDIHHRMPLVLDDVHAKEWLTKLDNAKEILKIVPDELVKI